MYRVVLTFDSVDEILRYDHFKRKLPSAVVLLIMLCEVVCKRNPKSVTFQIKATNVATRESCLTCILMHMYKHDQKRWKFLPVVMFIIWNSCL